MAFGGDHLFYGLRPGLSRVIWFLHFSKVLARIHLRMGWAKMVVILFPGIDERRGHRYGFSRTL